MRTEQDLLADWDLGTVTRAIEYCPHCEQQTRAGAIEMDDGSGWTLNVRYMHRDGSFNRNFVVGARVARKKGTNGLSLVAVLLR